MFFQKNTKFFAHPVSFGFLHNDWNIKHRKQKGSSKTRRGSLETSSKNRDHPAAGSDTSFPICSNLSKAVLGLAECLMYLRQDQRHFLVGLVTLNVISRQDYWIQWVGLVGRGLVDRRTSLREDQWAGGLLGGSTKYCRNTGRNP